LAEEVAIKAGLGRVLGDDGTRVVEFTDDILLNRIPQIVDGSHDDVSFRTRKKSAL
jgi:hypothetical protein